MNRPGTFPSGEAHWNYRGGRLDPRFNKGYNRLLASTESYVMEHVLIAERVLGHPLPVGAVVHHHNERRDDNRTENLVILQDIAEHNRLHRRRRVQRAGGNSWSQHLCHRCGRCKDFSEFFPSSASPCKACRRIVAQRRLARLMAAQIASPHGSLCPACAGGRA